MTYVGHIKKGVVVFDGPERPPEGAKVRIEEVPAEEQQNWVEVFKDLIGTVEGLPTDMAENHDHYIHGAPKR
jgi:hypothetical protein